MDEAHWLSIGRNNKSFCWQIEQQEYHFNARLKDSRKRAEMIDGCLRFRGRCGSAMMNGSRITEEAAVRF